MHFTQQDLELIDKEYLASLSHEKLLEISAMCFTSLAFLRDRIENNPDVVRTSKQKNSK